MTSARTRYLIAAVLLTLLLGCSDKSDESIDTNHSMGDTESEVEMEKAKPVQYSYDLTPEQAQRAILNAMAEGWPNVPALPHGSWVGYRLVLPDMPKESLLAAEAVPHKKGFNFRTWGTEDTAADQKLLLKMIDEKAKGYAAENL